MKKIYLLFITLANMFAANAQQLSFGHIQNQVPRDQRAINVFDVRKDTTAFKGISVDIGGAFALQFQAVNSFNHQGDFTGTPNAGYRLNNLTNDFNLPNANMTIGAQH